MSLRVSIEPAPEQSRGLRGLRGVNATDALGPGVEQPSTGELSATAPAVELGSIGPTLNGLIVAVGVGLLLGYIFRNESKE